MLSSLRTGFSPQLTVCSEQIVEKAGIEQL
jgi:hypothetical protein